MKPSLTILILLALAFIFLAATAAKAHAETMPPLTEPGAEAPQIAPARFDVVYEPWAERWQRIAKRQRRIVMQHTRALRMPAPGRVPCSYDYETWREYGIACKRLALYWRDARIPALHRRIVRPGGRGVARWAPLLRYCGMPERELARALRTMRRESGGNQWARNRASGAAGLYQFMPAWWNRRWNPYNPEQNVRHFVRATRHPRGWRHWAATAW